MNELPKSKTSWRIARRLLIALAVIATLIAIFYTEEDWRGKRAWENYRHEWEAKGEKFDWQAFVPSPVPDDQNFFKASIFDSKTEPVADRLYMTIYGDDSAQAPKHDAYWWKGTTTDLAEWQQYYRALGAKLKEFPVPLQLPPPAADVLFALSKYDAAIEELRQASQRPCSCLPLDYDQGLTMISNEMLPFLASLKRIVLVLELRSVAELQNGENEKALDDIKLMFRINDSIRNQPFLIAHLVRIAIFNIAMQPVWEGMVQHRWTDKQLAALEEELGKLDFLADYEFSMRGERAFAIQTFENQRITRQFATWDDVLATNIVHNYYFMPSAFFYQNELSFARIDQQWLLPLVDVKNHIISPATLRRNDLAVRAQLKHYSPYKVMALMTFQPESTSVRRFAIAQAGVDLARVGCALERYHLAHGEYPDSLDVLAPQFIETIPHDLINGQPLHYRRTSDGKFLLYSIGWNETDDGGKVAFTKNGSIDYTEGDWVWQATTK